MASTLHCALLLVLIMFMTSLMAASALQFNKDCNFYWGSQLVNPSPDGKLLSMSLVNSSGSAFQSNKAFLFGRFDMHIKLVPGNSAGTVTTFYISSQGQYHDEVDFEFLGNVSGQPYILHTNIFAKGVGGREQRFNLWFDPTADYYKYSVIWNPLLIILMVDDTPIRVFNNNEAIGVPFPNTQAMNIYSSIWCGDTWATQGGRVKTDWTLAPFIASYRNLKVFTCETDSYGLSKCSDDSPSNSSSNSSSTPSWLTQQLDVELQDKLEWVQNFFMIYNYCTDYERFPYGFPSECKQPRFLQ